MNWLGPIAVLAVVLAGCAAPGASPVGSPTGSVVATAVPASASSLPPAPTASPVVADACLVGPPVGDTDADRSEAVAGALEAEGFRTRRATVAGAAEVAAAVDALLDTRCALVLSVADSLGAAMTAVAEAHPDLPVAATGVTSESVPANLAVLGFDLAGAAYVAGDLAARTADDVGAVGLAGDASAPGTIAMFGAGAGAAPGGDAVRLRGVAGPRLVDTAEDAARVLARWSTSGTGVLFAASPGLAGAVDVGGAAVIGVGGDRPPDALAWIITDPTPAALAVTQQVADGVFTGAAVTGTLADGGVRLDVGDVPASVRDAVTTLADEVAAGRVAAVSAP